MEISHQKTLWWGVSLTFETIHSSAGQCWVSDLEPAPTFLLSLLIPTFLPPVWAELTFIRQLFWPAHTWIIPGCWGASFLFGVKSRIAINITFGKETGERNNSIHIGNWFLNYSWKPRGKQEDRTVWFNKRFRVECRYHEGPPSRVHLSLLVFQSCLLPWSPCPIMHPIKWEYDSKAARIVNICEGK